MKHLSEEELMRETIKDFAQTIRNNRLIVQLLSAAVIFLSCAVIVLSYAVLVVDN